MTKNNTIVKSGDGCMPRAQVCMCHLISGRSALDRALWIIKGHIHQTDRCPTAVPVDHSLNVMNSEAESYPVV